MDKRNNQHHNQQRQNTARKQARADLWDMLKAFIATPDLQAMHFANEVGELNLQKVERPEQRKRIGFDTTYAVGFSTDDEPNDEPDDEFDNYIRKIFKR